jgi:hypothetical protein
MGMFFLQYRCIPSEASENYGELGGAYINCWVKAISIKDARTIAELEIQENEWIVQELEESSPIRPESYENDDESLKYYQQAEIDGEVYVFHSWPNEPQEEDQLH